ncbi:hypothetical protein M9H77_07783 [Catharanthus roseus]|uniref:Uncharacterized protein n=1 Tax=Catharanthus roseus TaxID=4058 RepID=A0ACC0BW66_CATRO|nr:hypothetical protein M9H77_07783 [Catharanthus roseus]
MEIYVSRCPTRTTFQVSVLRVRLRNTTNDVKRIRRIHELMKQAKVIGGASSQPPLWMQRTPTPYFMNGQSEIPRKQFAYESPIEELDYDRSVVPMEKPLGKSC